MLNYYVYCGHATSSLLTSLCCFIIVISFCSCFSLMAPSLCVRSFRWLCFHGSCHHVLLRFSTTSLSLLLSQLLSTHIWITWHGNWLVSLSLSIWDFVLWSSAVWLTNTWQWLLSHVFLHKVQWTDRLHTLSTLEYFHIYCERSVRINCGCGFPFG